MTITFDQYYGEFYKDEQGPFPKKLTDKFTFNSPVGTAMDQYQRIWVADTGIVDYGQICRQLSRCFMEAGGQLRLLARVAGLAEDADGVTIQLREEGLSEHDYIQAIRSRYLVACCGLQADRVATMLDIPIDFQIVPFRGEYYQLPESKQDFVKHLKHQLSKEAQHVDNFYPNNPDFMIDEEGMPHPSRINIELESKAS